MTCIDSIPRPVQLPSAGNAVESCKPITFTNECIEDFLCFGDEDGNGLGRLLTRPDLRALLGLVLLDLARHAARRANRVHRCARHEWHCADLARPGLRSEWESAEHQSFPISFCHVWTTMQTSRPMEYAAHHGAWSHTPSGTAIRAEYKNSRTVFMPLPPHGRTRLPAS